MRARAGWRVALITVTTLAGAGRAAAQAAPAQTPDVRLLSLQSLRAGRSIRVGGREFGQLTGSFAGLRDGSLWLGDATTGRSVPITGIDSVWVSHSHGTTGAIVGSLVGLLAGVAAISGKQCSFLNDACIRQAYGTMLGISLGGTLLGAIIGGETKSWDPRYP